jgi:hypothetical protein
MHGALPSLDFSLGRMQLIVEQKLELISGKPIMKLVNTYGQSRGFSPASQLLHPGGVSIFYELDSFVLLPGENLRS